MQSRTPEPDPLAAALVAQPRVGAKRLVPVTLPDGTAAIRKDWPGDPDGSRLRREAAILEQLAGVEGIPELLQPFDGTGLLVRDVPYVLLSDVWCPGEPLDPPALLGLAKDLARLLAQVHARGVIHKNLAPQALILRPPEPYRLLLTDFDLASTFREERPGFVHHDRIAGDLHYIAPEQTGRTGRATDHRADLYSLGATLYALATGTPPFTEEGPLDLVRAHLTRVPVPPREINRGLRPDLSAVIMRLLEKEPDRRYQSAAGVAHDLELIAQRAAEGGPPVTLGACDFAERLSPPSRLVGRDDEIVRLRAAFERTLRGRAHAVVVRGAPGVGKTALLNELRPLVTSAGGWYVAGKFDQYRRGERFGAVAQALRSLAGLLLCEPDEELTALRLRLADELGVTAGVVAGFLPELALLTGAAPEPGALEDISDGSRLVRGCAALLRVVAERTPVVLAIDDLQWADSFSTALLDTMLADPTLSRVLVLVSYRGSDQEDRTTARWRRLDVPPSVLTLGNLPTADLADFLADMMRLDARRARELADAVLPHTGGNPFDTTELVNALRRAGVLTLTEQGWRWDGAAVHRHVRQDDVLDLIAERLATLPPGSQEALAALAALGGEVELRLLRAATGRPVADLTEALRPALEEGLLVLDQDTGLARFPHDRVQQAAHALVRGRAASALHLRLARALARDGGYDGEAAQQYLSAVDRLTDPAECRTAIGLFRGAAAAVRLTDRDAARHFLTTALALLTDRSQDAGDELRRALTIDLHAAYYDLGLLSEADALYRELVARDIGPVALAEPTCVQILSLTARRRMHEAVELGALMLSHLGVTRPFDLAADPGPGLARLAAWAAEDGAELPHGSRRHPEDPRVVAAAKILQRMMPPAYYTDPGMTAWLVLESHHLWLRHGPQAPLVSGLGVGAAVLIAVNGDHRGAYELGRRVEATAHAHAWRTVEPDAGVMAAAFGQPWFEPLTDVVTNARRGREGMLALGLQFPILTYQTLLAALVDGADRLDAVVAEAEASIATARRMSHDLTVAAVEPFLGWARALREGVTDHFTSAEDGPGLGRFYFHTLRAHVALLHDDQTALVRHSEAAMPTLTAVPGLYITAAVHLLRGIALARTPRGDHEDEYEEQLAWLRARAADNPDSFGHLPALIEAERLMALDCVPEALLCYEDALHAVRDGRRPWHRAFLAERAGLAHGAAGHAYSAATLLARAAREYQEWGAPAKATALRRTHALQSVPDHSEPAGTDRIDLMAVLTAARALSSETSLQRLRDRVADVLGSMTGATAVRLVVRDAVDTGWTLSTPDGDLALTDPRAADRTPVSALRFVERTGDQLVVADATHDGRFLRDPYLAARDVCSLLVRPLVVHGAVRAMLVLENTLSRDAFSAGRRDAVELIAGQLAVSLENAQLYASLENKVAERTAELAAANERLEQLNVTDPLTGVVNRRGLDERLAAEWLRARRDGSTLALAMIDIDHFKAFNDAYGHPGGDTCLRRVAGVVGATVRATDLVARYGGEEFAIVFPATALDEALHAAERVRAAVRDLAVPHEASPYHVVTVSIGCAALRPGDGGLPDKLIEAADLELYEAKRHRDSVSPPP